MNQGSIVRFRVEHTSGFACQEIDILDLKKWREEFRAGGLIGQDLARYDGLAYGNLSKRLGDGSYLITGSQTGHLETLSAWEFARITKYDLRQNLVCSTGLCRPSSETMTHLAVYQTNPSVRYVFHVHCAEIWSARDDLDIPVTETNVECGTLEMFYEVQRLLANWKDYQQSILAMGGHEDGIITWGKTADEAGSTLLSFLS
jgi:ribulose-5-phosphate 4-epimerase/fuculose-1-phosphate aldolase